MKHLSHGVVIGILGALVGCGDKGPKQEAKDAQPIVRDVPAPLRGTIGAESKLNGIAPTLVSGLGLVVGLDGTGGGPYPASVQATMEREIAKHGLGVQTMNDQHIFAGMSPASILADKSTAIVVVEGVVPPGSAVNAVFDLRVRTVPGSGVTSLEGGKLWATDLRLGPATVFGQSATRILAMGRGPVYINPFTDEETKEAVSSEGVVRTVGRVLGGGVVTEPLKLELVLDNPSHAKASAIQGAINGRFPTEPGQDDQTARGRSGQSIAVRIPPSYRTRSADFVNTLMAMRIDSQFGPEYAKRYVEELEKTPGLSTELSWCLEAIGRPAVPFLGRLYDHAELLPRMSALRAGARLEDPKAGPYLCAIARDRRNPIALRAEASELLGWVPFDAATDDALHELAGSEELEVRVAAYEAMTNRRDPFITRLGMENKFRVDLVPAANPLVYVTQTGEPRIVVFGGNLQLVTPMFASVWNDRLMLLSEGETDGVRALYRDARTGRTLQGSSRGTIADVLRLMARKPTPENPETGFNLSFSQCVGALQALQSQGTISASFAVERDAMVDRLVSAQQQMAGEDRPESAAKAAAAKDRARTLNPMQSPSKKRPTEEQKKWVVPLPPVAPTGK